MTEMLHSTDPSNNDYLGSVPITTSHDLRTIIARTQQAGLSWRAISAADRVKQIEKAYSAAEPAIHKLAELLSREMGKDIRRATGEVHGTVYGGPHIAHSALQALTPSYIGKSVIEYKPLGTVAVISPWNYPLAMANNLIIPALIAGNSVIWKPSEETPLIAQAFVDILQQHLPENVLQIIHGDEKQGRKLVESDVDMIAFTGSQVVGREIMYRASGSLKRLVMELGGNDPMIVLPDADLQSAAQFGVASSFENAGQMCVSTERIYVADAIADQFEKLVVETAQRYTVGPWHRDNVDIGPIINSKQHQKILGHIQDAIRKNGKLLLGATSHERPFIPPTVITNMTPDMLIEQEETFGPVVCISRYTDLDEAIDRANNSTYGLGAVVFGKTEAANVADRLEAGMIGINQGVGGEGDSPWVGAKQSGFGFHGSAEGHRQFAQIRVVNH